MDATDSRPDTHTGAVPAAGTNHRPKDHRRRRRGPDVATTPPVATSAESAADWTAWPVWLHVTAICVLIAGLGVVCLLSFGVQVAVTATAGAALVLIVLAVVGRDGLSEGRPDGHASALTDPTWDATRINAITDAMVKHAGPVVTDDVLRVVQIALAVDVDPSRPLTFREFAIAVEAVCMFEAGKRRLVNGRTDVIA